MPELFDGIEDGAQRIRQIVLNMKDYARKDVLDMSQEVDLNEVVQAALGLLSPCIKKYTSSASIFKAKRIPRVRGDRQRLEQVVVNLLQNACQSLPDRGKGIAVSVIHDEDRGENILCVSDEGTGIGGRSTWIVSLTLSLPRNPKRGERAWGCRSVSEL